MVKKKFNEICAYTYYIKRINDGKKYYGVRWQNIKFKRTPNEDLGKKYFSSGPFREDFKKNTKNYIYKISKTFSSIKEAQNYESRFNKKIISRDDWINQSAYPHLIHTNSTKEKISKANIGKKHKEESKIKIAKFNIGTKRTLSTRKKMSKAQRGKKLSESHKQKISEAMKKKLSRLGSHSTNATRLKISKSNKGKKRSQVTKSKISASLKGRRLSETHKKNISISRKSKFS